LLLADSMAAVLRLQVGLRVPVAIVDDDRVSGDQVQPQAGRPRRQQEHKRVLVLVEAAHLTTVSWWVGESMGTVNQMGTVKWGPQVNRRK